MAHLEVVDALPPNFESIVAVFPGARQPGIIFAYDGRIYAPGRTRIAPELHEHESVHIARQGKSCEAWWEKYLFDTTFRLEEELCAHRCEYRGYCRRHFDPMKQRIALISIATKLSSPLYGSMLSLEDAKKEIRYS